MVPPVMENNQWCKKTYFFCCPLGREHSKIALTDQSSHLFFRLFSDYVTRDIFYKGYIL